MKTLRFAGILSLLFIFTLYGCVSKKLLTVSKGFSDGRYDSEFPSQNASTDIEMITHSVKKLFCVSAYSTYQFRKEAKVTRYNLISGTYKKSAWGIISTSETAIGTATIIGTTNSRIALLTCSHIVHPPDTLVNYYEVTDDDPQLYVKSISIKEKQENWVKDLSACGSFQLLASDLSSDIAILGSKCESMADTVEPFSYRTGKAKELEWGTFVYVFGYPMGTLLITKGIVSLLQNREAGGFTVDALLNKGFSGGIILAIRDGIPNFELVGMVKTVHISQEPCLKPSEEEQQYPEYLPYKGEVYIGKSENIQYGLNTVVPFESIKEFYLHHRNELLDRGYNLDSFFNPGE